MAATMVCFNPCYVGLWSVSNMDLQTAFQMVGFQSLLCWIMVCKDREASDLVGSVWGFNPCYVGLWSVSQGGGADFGDALGFNPCYVGLWSVRE